MLIIHRRLLNPSASLKAMEAFKLLLNQYICKVKCFDIKEMVANDRDPTIKKYFLFHQSIKAFKLPVLQWYTSQEIYYKLNSPGRSINLP